MIAGSDDFNVYSWRIPSEPEQVDRWVGSAHHVLRGHRSIVNQVRFNADRHLVCSSGVEKVVRLWTAVSPTAPSEEELSVKKEIIAKNDTSLETHEAASVSGDNERERSMFTHEEYIDLVRSTGQSINHDYRYVLK